MFEPTGAGGFLFFRQVDNRVARQSLDDETKRKRLLAKNAGFGTGKRGETTLNNWLKRQQGYTELDKQYVPPELRNDPAAIRRSRKAERFWGSSEKRFTKLYNDLVVDENNRNHMSAKSFLDRYRDVIATILANPPSERARLRVMRLQKQLEKNAVTDNGPLPAHIAKNDRLRNAALEDMKARKFRNRQALHAASAYETERKNVRAKAKKAEQNMRKKRAQGRRRGRNGRR